MQFHLLSIFPEILDSYLNDSIIKRAEDKKLIKIHRHNLRHWTKDKHNTVDDTPYGGGAGMLMKIEPLHAALKDISKKNRKKNLHRKIILLSASGKTWNQKMAQEYSHLDELIFVCGRYEGIDARINHFIDEEVSIGDYVLTGGELPALVMIDSITRLIPGVLGNQESLSEESHNQDELLEYPQYTRPATFTVEGKSYKVPGVLQNGNHALIKEWQNKQKKKKIKS